MREGRKAPGCPTHAALPAPGSPGTQAVQLQPSLPGRPGGRGRTCERARTNALSSTLLRLDLREGGLHAAVVQRRLAVLARVVARDAPQRRPPVGGLPHTPQSSAQSQQRSVAAAAATMRCSASGRAVQAPTGGQLQLNTSKGGGRPGRSPLGGTSRAPHAAAPPRARGHTARSAGWESRAHHTRAAIPLGARQPIRGSPRMGTLSAHPCSHTACGAPKHCTCPPQAAH
jgi:hypothetical protein